MKKIYIAPELTVVKVVTTHLICESTLGIAQETTSTHKEGDETVPITKADARTFSIWGADEDE